MNTGHLYVKTEDGVLNEIQQKDEVDVHEL